ncbi:UDP-N-acetylglucosamine 2-epimerase [Kitasatospora sp. NPDC056138]|uniref:UDP-N-acetylglucosamine 2-epimerase n=1 Tax=Kitasatospora sp. NPDC056138 TaxID=3345724 RepID=UPI0035D75098
MSLHHLPRRPGTAGIAVVLGTRPELVELAPLIHELGPAARLVHTGQHWDEAMSGRFLRELDLPEPELLTGVGGRPRAGQIAAALDQLDTAFAADFLGLARHAALLISDSGGVQEECTVLGRPLLVVRRSTERPEAIDAGFAALVQPGPELGTVAGEWLLDVPQRLLRLAGTPSPYGDGLASARIARLTAALAGSTALAA